MFTKVDHRPWPLLQDPWNMIQLWHELLFIHWPIEPEIMRLLVPKNLEIDLYENRAWIGIVPFQMSGIHLRKIPPIPKMSAFVELNVRTYVQFRGKPGVYFFSLDAAHPLMAEIARSWYKLPYFRAEMSCEEKQGWVEYQNLRKDRRSISASFKGKYRPIGDVFLAEKGSLEHWLTERYCLFAVDFWGRVFSGEIHHDPWPLQKAELELESNTMTVPIGLTLPEKEPLLLFARKIEAFIWLLKKVGN